MKNKELKAVYEFLVTKAEKGELVPMSELASQFRKESSIQVWADPLERISIICIRFGLPPISLIVVNNSTKLPERSLLKTIAQHLGMGTITQENEMDIAITQMNRIFEGNPWKELAFYFGQLRHGLEFNTWIFQVETTELDIHSYINSTNDIFLPLKQTQHINKIRTGDMVYIWAITNRELADSGIIAKGTIKGKATFITEWFTTTEEDRLYVPIEIDDYKPESVLSRAELEKIDVLQGMRIFKMPYLTNYSITKEEGKHLAGLWLGTDTSSTKAKEESAPPVKTVNVPSKVEVDKVTPPTPKKTENEVPLIKQVDEIEEIFEELGLEEQVSTKPYFLNIEHLTENRWKYTIYTNGTQEQVKEVNVADKPELKITAAWIKQLAADYKVINIATLDVSITKQGTTTKMPEHILQKLVDLTVEKKILQDMKKSAFYNDVDESVKKQYAKAIRLNGTQCSICYFSYEDTFGKDFKGYATFYQDAATKMYQTMCPNCSTALKKRDCSISDLKKLISTT
ncbi:MAG: hypothetical protein ACRCWQ_14570 [Bacilli bacterium]